MMRFLLLLLFLSTLTMSYAQDQYTFFTDRRFFKQSDLIGYRFVPGKMEIPQVSKKSLEAGEVSIGITKENLFVKGPNIDGNYNISKIQSTEYGYKFELMNARNPAVQGHLKIILTKGAFADALVFKKDNKSPEMIFPLPEMEKSYRDKEKAFFTDWGEMLVEFPEDIWGKQFRPFMRINMNPKRQQRLYAKDSVSVSFVKKVKVIEKGKDKEEAVADEAEPVIEIAEEVVTEEAIAMESPEVKQEEAGNDSPFFSSPAPKKKEESGSSSPFFSTPKPKKEEAGNDSPFFSSPTKKETEPEEEHVPIDEVKMVVDPDAIPPIGEEEIVEEMKRRKKVKIEERYFINIKSLIKYQDGTSVLKDQMFPIKDWTERMDESAKPGEEKYQIEFEGNNGKIFYLYLNDERFVSSFEWKNEKLLVRD